MTRSELRLTNLRGGARLRGIGVAASAALALLVAACGGGSGTGTTRTAAGAASTTTTQQMGAGAGSAAMPTTSTMGGGAKPAAVATPAGAAASTPGSPATGSGQGASSSPPPTAGPTNQSADLGAPKDPGPAVAPKDGTYHYRSTDDAGKVTQLSIDIAPASGPGGATDQKETISSSRGSESDTYAWSGSGVAVSNTTLSGSGFSASCDWKPAIDRLAFPLKAGAAWSSHSTCSTTVSGQPVTGTEDMSANVIGLARIQEAGKVLDTWQMSRHSVFTAKGPTFSVTIDTTSTEWFAPRYGETPKILQDTKTSGTYTGKAFSQEAKSTIEAMSIDPS